MKKVLFGTTALVAAGMFAGAANAKDVELSLGGYMRVGVAVSEFAETAGSDRSDNRGVDDPEADQAFHIIRDGEIHFRGKGTLDNGLTIETRVELEAYTHDSDQIDENWVRISSQFGRILIGANDDAAYNTGYVGMGATAAPNMSFYDQTLQFLPLNFDFSMFSLLGGSDRIGIHYYTPNISGFSAGISYHPSFGSDGGADAQATGSNNDDIAVYVGANYSNSFGDFDFTLGGGFGYLEADGDGEETLEWGVGGEFGFSGATIYLRYEGRDSDVFVDALGLAGGIGYNTGPWSFLVGAGYQEYDNDVINDEQELLKLHAGVGYKLGNGVTLGGAIEYGDADGYAIDEDAISGALLLGVSF